MQRNSTKSLTLDKLKQLVDINGDLTNFRAFVKIIPKEEKVYEFAFVSQTILDNADISYQTHKGPFQHVLEINDNLYQNHFLCLRALSPLDVDVIIQLEEIPTQIATPKFNNATMPEVADNQIISPEIVSEEKFYHQMWFKVFIGCVVAIAGILIYKYYFTKSDKQDDKTMSDLLKLSQPKEKFSIKTSQIVDTPPAVSESSISAPVVTISAPVVTMPATSAPVISSTPATSVPATTVPVVSIPSESLPVQQSSVPLSENSSKSVNDFTSKLLSRLRGNVPRN